MAQIFNDEKKGLISLELSSDKDVETIILKLVRDGYGVRLKHPATQPQKVVLEINV